MDEIFCTFAGMTSLTLNSKLCNYTVSWNLTKTPQNFVKGSLSIKLTKKCHKNKGNFRPLSPLWSPEKPREEGTSDLGTKRLTSWAIALFEYWKPEIHRNLIRIKMKKCVSIEMLMNSFPGNLVWFSIIQETNSRHHESY